MENGRKECRDCDGSGLYYQIDGTPCHCIFWALVEKKAKLVPEFKITTKLDPYSKKGEVIISIGIHNVKVRNFDGKTEIFVIRYINDCILSLVTLHINEKLNR